MPLIRNSSIQRKLTFIIVCTSLVGLSLACLSFDFYERSSFRAAMTSELSVLADTLGANTAASLAFNDQKSAQDMLSALRAEPHIVAACLYDSHGVVFAEYRRTGIAAVFAMPSRREDGAQFQKDSLTLFRAVSLGGEKTGAIAIISDLGALQAKIKQYTEISVVVILFSILATYVVSSRLLQLITEPILHLAQVAARVTAKEDYGLRALPRGEDEVGALIGSFNQMLERIQERDAALQGVKNELELRVQARTQELQLEVNERIRAEETALRRNGKILRALIDNVPDFMYVKDLECRFLVANLSVARQMGAKTPAELLGKNDFDFYPREIAAPFYEDEQRVIRSGQAEVNREEAGVDSQGNVTQVMTTQCALAGTKTDGSRGLRRHRPRHYHHLKKVYKRKCRRHEKLREAARPGEERVSSQYVPRNSHAAERRNGNDRSGARYRTHGRAARISGDREDVGRFSAHGDQRHSRFLQD